VIKVFIFFFLYKLIRKSDCSTLQTSCKKMSQRVQVTAEAPVNIAVIKYWGKRDEKLVLPVNSSLSLTLHMDSLRSRSTITASTEFADDVMILNDKPVPIAENKRLSKVMQVLRERAEDLYSKDGKLLVSKDKWNLYKLRIESENNFPTAAGLASSASGFACLTAALSALYGVKEKFPGELSIFARQGSGSACRSMYGGFAKWIMGSKDDGSDSIAAPVAPENHWDDIRVLICVVNSGPKDVGSTPGMKRSVDTSLLLKYRAESVVEERMKRMEKYIAEKDFANFAELTMQDSNQFHAVCLDTYPPVFYMNDTSKSIIELVHEINESSGVVKAGYTFDAGPNAVIFTLKNYAEEVLSAILSHSPGLEK
jgi:diphosphomevalonate decarboxylase